MRALILLIALAGCDRAAEPVPVTAPIALASTRIALPTDESPLPDGPNVDVVTANCTACHSAEMTTLQPKLSPAKWQEEIDKMRTVYKAPVAKADDAAIVAYLTAMSAKLP